MGDCLDCMGRIPFASLVAFLISCVGVGISAGTLYRGLTIVITEVFEDLFHLDCVFAWTRILKWVFVATCGVMGLVFIMFLVFGFLATGATRKNIYTGTKCIMGGRVTAAFFIFLAYFLNFLWILVCVCLTVPTIFLLMLYLRCNPLIEFVDLQGQQVVSSENCISLNSFGFNLNATILVYDGYNGLLCAPGATEHLCRKDDIHLFCNKIDESYQYFFISLGGAILVVLGLVHFMIALSANYTRIRSARDLTEFHEYLDMHQNLTFAQSPPAMDYI